MDTSLLKNISERDIEKFKLLATLFNEVNRKEVITLRIFEDEYINYVKANLSPSYVRSIQSSFVHLNNFLGIQKVISEIKLKDAEKFMIWLQGKTKRGYRVYYRTLKAAFNKALEWDYISENPFVKVKLPKVQRVAPKYVTGDRLSVICEKINNEFVRAIIKTAFYTGLRLNEVVNLRWNNIDLERRLIIVGDEHFTTKSKKQRCVPICEELIKLLKVLSERQEVNEGFVFCKPDGSAYTGDYASKCFKDACRTLGNDEGIHFHSLRHSFASNLVQKGVSLYVVKELLGHSSISTTEIYSHLNVESLREAVKKLDGKDS
jgi:site-specific recombinase XerD